MGLTRAEQVRRLGWALGGDLLQWVHLSLTFAGPLLLLYLSRLDLSEAKLGLLLALLPLGGLMSLLCGPLIRRWGAKRSWMIATSLRTLVFAAIMLSPWIVKQYGTQGTLIYVGVILFLVAALKAPADSGYMVWNKRFVPDAVRGRFGSMQLLMVTGAQTLTMAGIGLIMGEDASLTSFHWAFGASVILGLISIWIYHRIPDEAPKPSDQVALPIREKPWSKIAQTLKVSSIRNFLLMSSLGWFGLVMATSFLPVFYEDRVGMGTDDVLYVTSAQTGASLLAALFWGWVSDRYGSRPVMIVTRAMMLVMPMGLLFLPLGYSWTHFVIYGLHVLLGLAFPGMMVATGRYLFLNLVPEEGGETIFNLQFAVNGLAFAVGSLLPGVMLDIGSSMGDISLVGGLTITPFTWIFAGGLVFMITSILLATTLPAVGEMNTRRFAGMFIQGNPLGYVQALWSYRVGGDEPSRVKAVEKLADSGSPLSVEELIESLQDPSFSVRMEAIISMARSRKDSRLVSALTHVLHGDEPELAPMAAWALGRLRDEQAREPLREALSSDYPLLRSMSARSLGRIQDQEAAGWVLELLRRESDENLRVSYASALGNMGRAEALPALLDLLDQADRPRSKREVAVAVATILGQTKSAVRLWRKIDRDGPSEVADAVLRLRKRAKQIALNAADSKTMEQNLEQWARAITREDWPSAREALLYVSSHSSRSNLGPAGSVVFWHACEMLVGEDVNDQPMRVEWISVCVHALMCADEEKADTQDPMM